MGDATRKKIKSVKVFNDMDNGTTYSNPEYAEKGFAFKIASGKREFYFATDTQSDLDKWFKSFHSTHSSGDVSPTEDSYTITHEDNEYSNILDRNDSDLMPVDEDNDDDEEKKSNVLPDKTQMKNLHSKSKTPLMDIIDPNGDGKWIDIENETIEQEQSSVLLS